MLRSFLGPALAAVCLTLSTAMGIAAEIGCDLLYTERPRFSAMAWEPSAERDLELWPSGRRPTMDVSCRFGFLEGEIVKGDYEKVLTFYRSNHPFLHTLTLRSSGGDVDTALKIGRLLRKYLVTARAPAHMGAGSMLFIPYDRGSGCTANSACACASACALIWFGAPAREGSAGLHRPRFTDPGFGRLPPAEAATLYRKALQSIGHYLDEMEAPKTVIDAMTSTASAEITWVDDGYGLLQDGVRMHRAPSFAEWVAASCGTFTHQEYQLRLRLQGIRDRQLSAQESKRYTALFMKQEAIDRCEHRLVASNRDRLPPP